jgi:hypothetical protein
MPISLLVLMLSSLSCGLRLFSAMPRLKRCFALVALPSVKLHGRVNVSWVVSHALARLDALTFSDPDAQTTYWFCAFCETLFRERIGAFGIGSSLFASKGDLSRFNQSSCISHISCFTHNLRYALPWSLRSSDGRFKGWPPLSAACPESRLGPSVCGKVLLF